MSVRPAPGTWTLRVLVASAVLAAAAALLASSRTGPTAFARVYGGPTEGVTDLALRIQVVNGDPLAPVTVTGSLTDGRETRDVASAVDGWAEIRLSFSAAPWLGPVMVTVSQERLDAPLARGPVEASTADWLRGAETGPRFIEQERGAFPIRVALVSGALAVPFTDSITVDLESAPEGELTLSVKGDGIAVEGSDEYRATLGPGERRRSLQVTPNEHSVLLVVEATAPGGEQGWWVSGLPVIPGAFWLERRDERWVVRSPVPRQHAFVSVISRSQRLQGAVISLEAQQGGVEGELSLLPLPAEPTWAVVASEGDSQSMALVGWPLRTSATDREPRPTFTVPDLLLLDGHLERARAQAGRLSWIRGIAAAYCLLAGFICAAFVWRRGRMPRPSGHPDVLESVLASSSAPDARFAALLVFLAFAVLAGFVLSFR